MYTPMAKGIAYKYHLPWLCPKPTTVSACTPIRKGKPSNERFYAKIERMTGRQREAGLRGRPRLDAHVTGQAIAEQGELPL